MNETSKVINKHIEQQSLTRHALSDSPLFFDENYFFRLAPQTVFRCSGGCTYEPHWLTMFSLSHLYIELMTKCCINSISPMVPKSRFTILRFCFGVTVSCLKVFNVHVITPKQNQKPRFLILKSTLMSFSAWKPITKP